VRGWLPPAERLRQAPDGSTVTEAQWEALVTPDLASLKEVADVLNVSMDYLLGSDVPKRRSERTRIGVLSLELSRYVFDELARRRPGRLFVDDIVQVLGADLPDDRTAQTRGIPEFSKHEEFLKLVCAWTEAKVAEQASDRDAAERDAVQDTVVDLLGRVDVLDSATKARARAELHAAHHDSLSAEQQENVWRWAEAITEAEEFDSCARAKTDLIERIIAEYADEDAEAGAGDEIGEEREALHATMGDLVPHLSELDRYADAPFTAKEAGARLSAIAEKPLQQRSAYDVQLIFDAIFAIKASSLIEALRQQHDGDENAIDDNEFLKAIDDDISGNQNALSSQASNAEKRDISEFLAREEGEARRYARDEEDRRGGGRTRRAIEEGARQGLRGRPYHATFGGTGPHDYHHVDGVAPLQPGLGPTPATNDATPRSASAVTSESDSGADSGGR
jgi:hypothetical protein